MTKRLILSFVMIALALAGVTSATVAYFSDTATITGSTFSAGTMDLKIDGASDPGVYSWADGFANPYPAFSNLYPGYPTGGEHNWQVLDIKNVGAVGGYATIKFIRTSNADDLRNNLIFTVYFDGDNNGNVGEGDDWITVASGTLAQFEGNTYTLGNFTGSSNNLGGLNGQMASVKIAWSVPTTAGNEIQGDSVTLDTVFGLEQTH